MKTIKLKDILSISGKGGLFKFIAQARNGIVVESIGDNKRHVAPGTARVSSLEDIAIFTHEEEVPLSDIFMMIHEKEEGKETISHKSTPDDLKNYFQELVPEFDDERVYISDIKKVFQWYNQLHSHDLLEVVDKEEEKDEKEEDKPGTTPEKPVATKRDPSKKEVAARKDVTPKKEPVKKSTAARKNTTSK